MMCVFLSSSSHNIGIYSILSVLNFGIRYALSNPGIRHLDPLPGQKNTFTTIAKDSI